MIVKKICNFLSTVVLFLLMVVAAVILVPMILGFREMAVLSGSIGTNLQLQQALFGIGQGGRWNPAQSR